MLITFKKPQLISFLCLSIFSIACSGQEVAIKHSNSIETENWGKTGSGQFASLFTLRNKNGLTLRLTNQGATVVSLEVPDRNGKLTNITAGFDKLEDYLAGSPYFGATVGRFCNRIALGKFSLGGKKYQLSINNGKHHLHGGTRGFDKVLWDANIQWREDAGGIRFQHLSKDGEEGYPGNLSVAATYWLTDTDSLIVELEARTDQATPVNLTNHCYWNLGGVGSGTIHNHLLQIESDKTLAVDSDLITTGKFVSVEGTPFDFRKFRKVGERINENKLEPNGYDHCFVLNSNGNKQKLAATVKDPESGRVMKIYTDQIGLQFYSGNFLNGDKSNGGNDYQTLLCLETQHFPNSPNIESFPSTILKPGETYRFVTEHHFSVEK